MITGNGIFANWQRRFKERTSLLGVGLLCLLFIVLAGVLASDVAGQSLDSVGSAALPVALPASPADIKAQITTLPGSTVRNAPALPSDVLFDQYNNISWNSITSQHFEPAYTNYDTQAADDFFVPAGQTWSVGLVEVAGAYNRNGGPADSVNVFFYTDSSSLPSTPVFTQTNILYAPGPNPGDFVITLNPTAVLAPGHYWLSVQANQNYGSSDQWFWRDRSIASYSEAAWRNPGGGHRTIFPCRDWRDRAHGCFSEWSDTQPDQTFRLSGLVNATPSPTLTGTPPTSISTRTPTPATPTVTGTRNIPPPVVTPEPVVCGKFIHAYSGCHACAGYFGHPGVPEHVFTALPCHAALR